MRHVLQRGKQQNSYFFVTCAQPTATRCKNIQQQLSDTSNQLKNNWNVNCKQSEPLDLINPYGEDQIIFHITGTVTNIGTAMPFFGLQYLSNDNKADRFWCQSSTEEEKKRNSQDKRQIKIVGQPEPV